MNGSLHLNLIKDEEIVSSSPIRSRVMLPLVGGAALLASLLAWGMAQFRVSALEDQKARLVAAVAERQGAHRDVLRLRGERAALQATFRQFGYYTNSCVRWAEMVSAIAGVVPTNIQLTALNLVPPPLPRPPADKAQAALWHGPTNASERATLIIEGMAKEPNREKAINALVEALNAPPFTNRIEKAEIRKGGTWQDSTQREFLHFKITCAAQPRRFE